MPPVATRLFVHLLPLLVLASFGCKSTGSTAPDDGTGGSGNRAPTIAGNPDASITVGEEFYFEPVAQDPDGDALTFTISNKPDWATFEPAFGQLSGTPTAGSEGTYNDIRISVSDGMASASLTFDVAVNAEGTEVASITLSWTAPTQNDDGSALTDLAGYKIYYGRSSGNYSNEVSIDNPSVSTYIIENLSETTWYIAATSFNTDGVESDYTTEIEAVAN